MITHIVLLQLKPEVTEGEIITALDHVRALHHIIPGIVNVEAGKNLSSHNQGYTYGFSMHFVDAEHFRPYASHPAHLPVSEELQRICQSIIDFDFEWVAP